MNSNELDPKTKEIHDILLALSFTSLNLVKKLEDGRLNADEFEKLWQERQDAVHGEEPDGSGTSGKAASDCKSRLMRLLQI